MFPSLQPSRPKAQSQQALNPLCQQQIRQSHNEHPAARPTNQVQAMPPHKAPIGVEMQQSIPSPLLNPATTHPVFFSDCWRRPPFPMPFNNGFSPAATGYVFVDGRNRAQSMTKL